jgi:integrase/recombinase XerD
MVLPGCESVAKIRTSWDRSQLQFDTNPTMKRFERWMKDRGYRDASIDGYLKAIRLYLRILKTITPSIEDAIEYHSNMAASNLARATVNIRRAALIAFNKSQGLELKLPYLKPNNQVPYFFNENDVAAILNSCINFKHYAMLNLMFHCMLRVSDLCNLEDGDVDLKTLTLRIRDGKGGKSALLPIPPECVEVLRSYLEVRPLLEIDRKQYLFYTDWRRKWSRRSVEQTFQYWKDRAGVTKPGGVHVFGRHTPASIMVKNGCDVYSLQQLMRHSSIKTTARYLHTDIATLREKQIRFLDV